MKEKIDFEDFINSSNTQVPGHVKQKTQSTVHGLLNPKSEIIFLKILGIYLVIGFLSLSICHQFGVNPFQTEWSLDRLLMSFGGHQICMLICGILFVGVSLLVSGYFLTLEEVLVLRRHQVLHILTLGLISIGLFAAFGAELILSIGIIWLVGGFIGGVVAITTLWRLKIVV